MKRSFSGCGHDSSNRNRKILSAGLADKPSVLRTGSTSENTNILLSYTDTAAWYSAIYLCITCLSNELHFLSCSKILFSAYII